MTIGGIKEVDREGKKREDGNRIVEGRRKQEGRAGRRKEGRGTRRQ